MRIAFDAKRVFHNNTGLGNYSRLVVDLLSRFYPDNDYQLYTPRISNNGRAAGLLERENISIFEPKRCLNRSLWRINSITKDLKRNGVDIFHGLSNELPLNIKGEVASVVTIHDLIFLRYPEYYKRIDRNIYDYKFRKGAENANRVIAISEMTKCDLINFYGISADKIDVVYQGCDSSFHSMASPEKLAEVKGKYSLPDKFLLNVGTIESRKNVELVVRSLSQLDKGKHLVIVGRATPYLDQVMDSVRRYHLEDRVHIYHNLPFGDLPSFYQLAEIFIYPSRFEGFGIPVLESLYSGTPVITATGSTLQEAGGSTSLTIDADDVDGLSTAINRISSDSTLRNQIIERGHKFTEQFSDERIAENTYNVYNKIWKE